MVTGLRVFASIVLFGIGILALAVSVGAFLAAIDEKSTKQFVGAVVAFVVFAAEAGLIVALWVPS